MNRTLMTLFTLFVALIPLSAQQKYYTESHEIQTDSFTYICDVDKSRTINLYNQDNVYNTRSPQVNTVTNERAPENREGNYLQSDNLTYNKCISICYNAIPKELLTPNGEHCFIVSLFIDSQTGQIRDVLFTFVDFENSASISPEVYRQMEVALKKNVCFTPTAEGKKVNYIYRYFTIEMNPDFARRFQ